MQVLMRLLEEHGRPQGRGLTEVVVVFRRSGEADLLYVDVGRPSRNAHHHIISYKKEGREEQRMRTRK